MICGHGPSAIPFDDPKRACILGETRPLKDEVDSLTGQVDALTDQASNLLQQLQIVKQSKSWKITEPLRFLRSKLFDLIN
jgi:hypothetical protein